MFAPSVFGRMMDSVDCAPWGASAGRRVANEAAGYSALSRRSNTQQPLYSPEEKRRRDATPWTLVQGILAPVQFLVFAVSLSLVLRYLFTGGGESAATTSVVVKTLCLYTIMVTGAIWERKVFGQYLFAPAFFWEDAVSMIVIALHTAYLVALVSGSLDTQSMMLLALAAYATYVVNATQFVLKLRAARLSEERWTYDHVHHGLGHA
jgi:3-vinyl bacteriochlorophyllide hydratase